MGILDDLRHKAEELGEKAKEGLDAARDRAGDLVDDVRERLGQHEGEQAPTRESGDVGPDSSSTDAVQPGYVTGEDEVAGSGDDSLSDETDGTGTGTGSDTDTDSDLGTGRGQAQGAVDSVGSVDPVAAADAETGQDDATTGSESVGEELSADLGTEDDGSSSVADDTDGAATTETDGADLVDPQDTGAGETPSTTDLLDSETGAADGSYAPDDAVGTAEGGDEGDAPVADDAPLEPVATDVDPYAEPLTEPIGQEIALDEVDPETLAKAVENASEQDS